MNLDTAEERLGIERRFLIHAEHTGRTALIALAQQNVARWEEIVRTERLREQGGW